MAIIKEDNKLNAIIDGKLDTLTAPVFEKEVTDVINGVTDITLDLSETIYISSAGLRVILGLEKKMHEFGGKMTIKNVPDIVMEVFTETGLSEILTIV